MSDLIRLDIEGGKYTIIQVATGGIDILRYGEPWMENPKGSKMLLAMAYELEEARATIAANAAGKPRNRDGEAV